MRRIIKIFVILAIIIVAFLTIAYIFPEVKAAVDSAVGPQVSGFLGSIVAGIEPVYTTYLAPWPNHAFFWGAIGAAFIYTVLWSWDELRLRAKQSIDSKAGVYGTKTSPIQTQTSALPTPVETKEDEPEEKT